MALLRFDSLSFAYPDASCRALDHISFSLEEGEYMVVCGESGCGKTTLLRQAKPELIPAGAKEGQVYFMEEPVEKASKEMTAMKIGFVQQNPDNQIVTDFVWHELAFGLENMALPTEDIRRRVGEMASFFGMESWFHKKTCELSGGQKQMLNLASVMAMNPKLLILDEPTSMLDPLASRNLLGMIHRINRELGVAVLICEHHLEEVFQQADKVLLLKEGEILAEDTPRNLAKKLQKAPEASRIYFGLPGAVRIFGELERKGIYQSDGTLPISVREARKELKELLGQKTLKIKIDEEKESTKGILRRTKEKEEVLSGTELWFRYSEKSPDVLRGLSVKLEKGEILALLGGNGAGKSTLLKLLAGINRPLRGKVRSIAGSRIAMLPQSPQALFTCDSLWEDLLDAAGGKKETDGEAVKRIKQVAEQLELENKLTSHPYDLSGGELQRAAIAKLLLQRADILLLDEPTKGLDAYLKQELAGHLRKLAEDGTSILMVTHDLEFAASYADRCALLFDGQIISQDEPHRFFRGNRFYTTTAGLISGEMIENSITCEEVIKACEKQMISSSASVQNQQH